MEANFQNDRQKEVGQNTGILIFFISLSEKLERITLTSYSFY